MLKTQVHLVKTCSCFKDKHSFNQCIYISTHNWNIYALIKVVFVLKNLTLFSYQLDKWMCLLITSSFRIKRCMWIIHFTLSLFHNTAAYCLRSSCTRYFTWFSDGALPQYSDIYCDCHLIPRTGVLRNDFDILYNSYEPSRECSWTIHSLGIHADIYSCTFCCNPCIQSRHLWCCIRARC